MAAFRLLYFPPASRCLFHTHLLVPPSPSLTPCIPSFTCKPQRHNFQLFLAPEQAQAQPAFQSEFAEEDEASNTRVLVQNVPWTCTANDLRPLFEECGTVVDIEFSMYNKNRNRGLAFVTMNSHEEALAALNNLESTDFEGRVLRLNWARPKKAKVSSPPAQPKPLPVHNLFVANLAFQARAKDLKEFFNAENENVVSAEVIFNNNRQSVGYGFVSFNTKAEAEAALTAFQRKEFMGRPLRVARSRRFLREETKVAIQSE